MKRIIVFGIFLITFSLGIQANNVRLVREVTVDAASIVNGVAILDFQVAWDNSWRDDFNWDAVYVFVKYKKKGDTEWRHAYLLDNYHEVTSGFAWWIAKSEATADRGMGAFIYRDKNQTGVATVDVKLKWLISANGLVQRDFGDGNVDYSAMLVEMVYIPKGAYCLGDGVSTKTFQTRYRPILPEWDVIKNDGKIKYSASGVDHASYKVYPPENAANRVNETRANGGNAWGATAAGESRWVVDFGAGNEKAIRYFGVSGLWGHEAYRPQTWTFEGSLDGLYWQPLTKQGFAAADWVIAYDSYPVPYAMAVDKDKVQKRRYYRINIATSSNIPYANNIAMTEMEIDTLTNYAYLVDKQTPIVFNQTTELCADDADTWASTLQVNYPTGFEGFYVMKYEVTQEQYIRFLNKLQSKQQKLRTIGESLQALDVGQYVYGRGISTPSFRNGIIVGAKIDGGVIFANDLDKSNDFSQEGDGQTLACNFLSPADMLAYADWTGLRPLSEMEYEKMARRPFPNVPKRGEYAWNSNTDLKLPNGETFVGGVSGTSTERLVDANVNAGGEVSGPVRVGSFAKNAGGDHKKAGASYWGVMELSGNLSEIYYNLNTEGRPFHYIREAHGNGVVLAESHAQAGDTDMSASYWPIVPGAFTLRGGNFKSPGKQITISDRTTNKYYSDINKKDSTAGFRLGHSYTNLVTEVCTTYLKLENGRISTGNGVAVDSVCVGRPYTIKGSTMLKSSSTSGSSTVDVPLDMAGRYNYIWYISENSGTTWKVVPNENGQNLTYTNWGHAGPDLRPVWIKRKTLTSTRYSETFYAILNVINDTYEVNRLRDTIKDRNHVLGFLVETKSPSDYTWRWKAADVSTAPLRNVNKNATSDFYFSERDHFNKISKQEQVVVCELNVFKKCRRNIEFKVYVEERLEVGVATSDITMDETDKEKGCGVMMQDSRTGGFVYGTVKIGNQCWMAENLRFLLPGKTVHQLADPSGEKLGALYNNHAEVINLACPAGWRMPSNADFNQLNSYLTNINNNVGAQLKAGNHWATTTAGKVFMGTNSTGFGAVGVGHEKNTGYAANSYFITTDDHFYYVTNENNTLRSSSPASHYYMGLRCIKR